jgi:hypothetical protein
VLDVPELEPRPELPALPLVLPAPMEVPPPVAPVVPPMLEPVPVPAVVSVLPLVPMELEPVPVVLPPAPALVLLDVSLGEVVVDGVVLEVLELLEPAPASSRLPQADRDRAAIRARAAHCAIGDLIIRYSLRFRVDVNRERESGNDSGLPAACGSL